MQSGVYKVTRRVLPTADGGGRVGKSLSKGYKNKLKRDFRKLFSPSFQFNFIAAVSAVGLLHSSFCNSWYSIKIWRLKSCLFVVGWRLYNEREVVEINSDFNVESNLNQMDWLMTSISKKNVRCKAIFTLFTAIVDFSCDFPSSNLPLTDQAPADF